MGKEEGKHDNVKGTVAILTLSVIGYFPVRNKWTIKKALY